MTPDSLLANLDTILFRPSRDRKLTEEESTVRCINELKFFILSYPTLANYIAFVALERAKAQVKTIEDASLSLFKVAAEVGMGSKPEEDYDIALDLFSTTLTDYYRQYAAVSRILRSVCNWIFPLRSTILSRIQSVTTNTEEAAAYKALHACLPTLLSARKMVLSSDLSISVVNGIGSVLYENIPIELENLVFPGNIIRGHVVLTAKGKTFTIGSEETFTTSTIKFQFTQIPPKVFIPILATKKQQLSRILSLVSLDTDNYYVRKCIRGYGLSFTPVNADSVETPVFPDAIVDAFHKMQSICAKWAVPFVFESILEDGLSFEKTNGNRPYENLLEAVAGVAVASDNRRIYV